MCKSGVTINPGSLVKPKVWYTVNSAQQEYIWNPFTLSQTCDDARISVRETLNTGMMGFWIHRVSTGFKIQVKTEYNDFAGNHLVTFTGETPDNEKASFTFDATVISHVSGKSGAGGGGGCD